MRLVPLLAALALLITPAVRAEDGLAGRYGLVGLESPAGRVDVDLVVEPLGGDRYRVTRTARRGSARVALTGEGTRAGDDLTVRFHQGAGLAGVVGGVAAPAPAHEARYRVSGPWIAGRVRGPGTAGRTTVTRELGRRREPLARTPAQLDGRLRVVGQALQDPQGRTVLLRGVNAGKKAAPFLAPHTPAEVRRLVERTGVNFVRLYFAWRAIEPRPLEYDEAYLDAAAAQVRAWADAGVHVLVDLHQDLWGAPLADHGAPEWASFGRGAKRPRLLPETVPWQLRYVDPRVYESFEAFWSDRVVPASGLGLQEHYARAWQQLARRLAGVERVAGYDPMNEPFMGREIKSGLRAVALGSAGTVLRSGLGAGLDALLGRDAFADALTRRLVERLRDPARFQRTIDRLRGANERFERRLSAFYARVGRAIRQVDPGRPLFVEPMPLAGVGAPSALPHPGLDQVVYAPHLYDPFMDSGLPYDGDVRRAERTFARHVENARRLGAPLVVGEWGNLIAGAEPFARRVGDLFDAAHAGSAYWDHVPGREDEPLFLSAFRPYPARVAGALRELAWDAAARALSVRWAATVDAPTVIALPRATYPAGVAVQLDGDAEHEVHGDLLLVWGRGEVRVRVVPR